MLVKQFYAIFLREHLIVDESEESFRLIDCICFLTLILIPIVPYLKNFYKKISIF